MRCPKCGWGPWEPGTAVLIPSDDPNSPWEILTGENAGKKRETAVVVIDLHDGYVVVRKPRGKRIVLPMDDISPLGPSGVSGL
jgi:hypothetical protein